MAAIVLSWYAMPVIKVFTHAPLLADDRAAPERLAVAVSDACTGILRAAPAQIQLMLVPVAAVLRGEPIYAEVNFRATEFRDASVVDAFMRTLERDVAQHLGAVPRIRCFSENQTALFARN